MPKAEYIADPYKHFYLESAEEDGINIVLDQTVMDYNPENYRKYINEELFPRYEKEKAAWLYKAAKHDPAFMIDEGRRYYLSLLPKQVFNALNEAEINRLIALYDPVEWGKQYLLKKHGGWKPRCSRKGIPYQSMIIRSKAKRLCMRAGRRLGKSAGVIVKILHRSFTYAYKSGKPTFNVVIFTPNQAQINVIFKMMQVFVDDDPELLSMVVNGQMPTRQSPNYVIEFKNGVTITGYVSGSTAIRGSAADLLWLDEASFLTQDDIDAVVSLLTEHKDVELIVTSTPKGLKDWFYEKTIDPEFIDFHFPSPDYHPFWDAQMEADIRKNIASEAGYKHEVLALFSEDGEGVFQNQFIDASKADYSYNGLRPIEGRIYGLGVDWNDPGNGTTIRISEYDPVSFKYRTVYKDNVSIEGWTQTTAVHRVVELNRIWRPAFLYVDQGYGTTQIENLHEIGTKAPIASIDRQLLKVKGISFKSNVEVYDPFNKQKVKKEMKFFMVNNTVRILENKLIDISIEDTLLFKQLEGYHIDRYTPVGAPVYKPGKFGDHDLDALMLSLLGFILEYSSLGKPYMSPPDIVPINAYHRNTVSTEVNEFHKSVIRDKKMELDEVMRHQPKGAEYYGSIYKRSIGRENKVNIHRSNDRIRNAKGFSTRRKF